MRIFCRFSGDGKIILRGPITTDPYKGWFELDRFHWGGNELAHGTAGTGRSERAPQKSLYTEATFASGFLDIYTFSLTQTASAGFTVQCDFLGDDATKGSVSIILDDAMLGNVYVSEINGRNTVLGSIWAKAASYVYIGADKPGAPAITVRKAT